MAKATILIVDDEPYNIDYLEQELADLGYATLSACNGQEALDKVKSGAPDLVLLDIMMPVMDGFSVLERMKADPLLVDIPVIIISAVNDLKSVVRGVERGAEDYLPKPFEPVLLHARISSSLEKKRLRDEQRRLIRTFAGKTVADQLIREGFSLGGKRAVVTVVFCDIRNFTTITESNDPGDVIEMINHYYQIVIETIQSNGGNASQMQGDGLLSFFGAPVYYPDHAARAVTSAIEIRRRLAGYNRDRAENGGLQIEVGFGITTGPVVAGFAGTHERATYLCVGDTVNLGARLEAHTKVIHKPIVIDETTRAMLDESFQVEPAGEELFKGKSYPVMVYSVEC